MPLQSSPRRVERQRLNEVVYGICRTRTLQGQYMLETGNGVRSSNKVSKEDLVPTCAGYGL